MSHGRKFLWSYTVMDCSVGTRRRRKIPAERDRYFYGFVMVEISTLCLTFIPSYKCFIIIFLQVSLLVSK